MESRAARRIDILVSRKVGDPVVAVERPERGPSASEPQPFLMIANGRSFINVANNRSWACSLDRSASRGS
jgi:hypothetical protein